MSFSDEYNRKISTTLLIAIFTISVAACDNVEDGYESDSVNVRSFEKNVSKSKSSYEDFLASLPFSPNGSYIVENDIQISSDVELKYYYNKANGSDSEPDSIDNLAIVNTDPFNNRTLWSTSQANSLTYCVAYDPIGFNGGFTFDEWVAVSNALSQATADWEKHTNINFQHLKQYDANCTESNGLVLFRVSPSYGNGYAALAFFPGDSLFKRTLYIDVQSIPGWQGGQYVDKLWPVTLAGLMRHELGHILGLRHEHIRPGALNVSCSAEDRNWDPLTPYDPFSVMHYQECATGANSRDLIISDYDIAGIQTLYGVRAGSPSLVPNTPPTTPPIAYQRGAIISGALVVVVMMQ